MHADAILYAVFSNDIGHQFFQKMLRLTLRCNTTECLLMVGIHVVSRLYDLSRLTGGQTSIAVEGKTSNTIIITLLISATLSTFTHRHAPSALHQILSRSPEVTVHLYSPPRTLRSASDTFTKP